jgi:hypothetical protein
VSSKNGGSAVEEQPFKAREKIGKNLPFLAPQARAQHSGATKKSSAAEFANGLAASFGALCFSTNSVPQWQTAI